VASKTTKAKAKAKKIEAPAKKTAPAVKPAANVKAATTVKVTVKGKTTTMKVSAPSGVAGSAIQPGSTARVAKTIGEKHRQLRSGTGYGKGERRAPVQLPDGGRGDGERREHDEHDLPVACGGDAFENGDAQRRAVAGEPADQPAVDRDDFLPVEDVLRETGYQEGNIQQGRSRQGCKQPGIPQPHANAARARRGFSSHISSQAGRRKR